MLHAMKANRSRRFGDLAGEIAARLPVRKGLVFGASRHTIGEIAAHRRGGASLEATGVGNGEHVALWLSNW